MKYKHYYIGRKCFVNVYRNIEKKHLFHIKIHRYNDPTIIVFEFKWRHFGFDLGYSNKKTKVL